ncbi:MAG: glycosyltransferase family 4 protein [Thermodesulfobacteriota bacterium]
MSEDFPDLAGLRVAVIGLRSVGGCCQGGIETHMEELAPRLAALGLSMTLFTRSAYDTLRVPTWRGVRLLRRPSLNTKHLEAVSHTALCSLEALAGYDLVHYQACGPALFSWLPRLTGRKVVCTVHALEHRRAKWGHLASAALSAGAWAAAHIPHRTIVVSRPLQEHYRRVYGRDAVFIPNGVSPPRARPLDGLRRFGLEPGGYILFLGRLVPEKGVHTLIRAWNAVPSGLRLVVAGAPAHTPAYAAELRALAAADPRIVFTGPLYGADKDEAFANARLFVLPSQLEGLPIALLEAMAHGLPVLCSDIPECAGVAEGAAGEVMRTFLSNDPENLSRALGEMLAEPDLAAMGRRARAFALESYSWDHAARATARVYRQALASQRSVE